MLLQITMQYKNWNMDIGIHTMCDQYKTHFFRMLHFDTMQGLKKMLILTKYIFNFFNKHFLGKIFLLRNSCINSNYRVKNLIRRQKIYGIGNMIGDENLHHSVY